ncbi:DUF58 domain-containing protein [Mycobacterium sp.]|uniref:DUF58 domain-containing protein n=1 Tax=Mycobacterium sp. TaxID=1785 RepID=UPI003A892068
MTEPRNVEFGWRASPLTLAAATCTAIALAAAVIAGCPQLIAFSAPLLGVLCSLGWQPRVPVVRVYGEPDAQRCFEGDQTQVTVWTTTDSDAASVELTVSAPDGMELDVQGLGQRKQATAVARRWGRYPVRARIELLARGGLVAGTGAVDVCEVIVFPLTPPQTTPTPPAELRDRLGVHLTHHRGPGVEYADIRPYVPGDQLRTVNWAVSARRGRLHVTQRLTDRAADVVVLADAYRQPAGPATEATERVVRGAAQVVQTALRSGDRAGIVALGDNRPRWFGADLGQRQFYRVLDTLLGAGDGFDNTTGTLAPRAAVPVGAIVVAFSVLLETEFVLALIDLRKRGHVVVVVNVLTGSPFESEQDPLVLRLWTLHRSAMYRDLAAVGVEVLSWPEDRALEQSMGGLSERRHRARRRMPGRR